MKDARKNVLFFLFTFILVFVCLDQMEEQKNSTWLTYKASNKLKKKLGLKNWRGTRGDTSKYTYSMPEKCRCDNKLYVPRLVFDAKNNILEIYYPYFNNEADIDVRHTRREVERGLKELLKPHKYLAVVTRDNIWKKNDLIKYNYTIDYYAEVDRPPTDEEISAICEICENPILE